MTITSIKAHIECDECGKPFSVEIELADTVPEGWSMFEVGEDAVRGSLAYKDGAHDGSIFSSSVQGGKHLCRDCTTATDHDGHDSNG